MWLAHSNQQIRIVTENRGKLRRTPLNAFRPSSSLSTNKQCTTAKKKENKRHFALWSIKHVLSALQTLPEALLPHLCCQRGYAECTAEPGAQDLATGVGETPRPDWNVRRGLPERTVITTPAQCPLCQWHSNQLRAQGHSCVMLSLEIHCVGRTHAITLPRARMETALAHSRGITTQ